MTASTRAWGRRRRGRGGRRRRAASGAWCGAIFWFRFGSALGVPVPFVAPRVWARWGWDRAGHVASHLRDLRVIRRAARFVLDFPRVNIAMVPVGVGEVRFGDRSRCERDADGEGRSKPSITGTIVIDATWRYAPRHLHWHRRLDSRASRRLGGVEVAGGCARHEAPLLFWQSGPPKEKAGSVFGCHEGAYLSTLERRTRGVRCRCERVSTGSARRLRLFTAVRAC